ncbi:hypothetical protein FB561_5801 [Kribbella amoyensis]|uniref:Lysylphosphatidylglycerol synthase-like protein n=1 Tax=Kribbella amoyensis TaxID=996641 RepID=A0A561C0N0_9ACTN|nr:YbhN family protein [Kribbella amoyensis]TWD84607.1 hypothetical protein FB561_5801 [Kribbella amoyensis]
MGRRDAAAAPWGRRSQLRLWSVLALLTLLALIAYFGPSRFAEARAALHRVGTMQPAWVALAIVLEACSLVCYSLFTRALLRPRDPRFSWILRSDLTGYGVSHVVPGGGATAAAIRFRLLTVGGARPTDVTATIAAEGVGTWLALVLIAWLTTIPAIVFHDAAGAYLVVFGIGLVLGVGGIFAARERTALERLSARLLRSSTQRLPRRARSGIKAVAVRLRDFLADPKVRKAFLLWATLNWLFDAAVLGVFLAAYGDWVDPVTLLLSYCLANLAGIIPLTPGGLGIVEAVAISSLAGFGVDTETAVLAVLSWRLVQFWLPVPVAGACYLTLRAQLSLTPDTHSSTSNDSLG